MEGGPCKFSCQWHIPAYGVVGKSKTSLGADLAHSCICPPFLLLFRFTVCHCLSLTELGFWPLLFLFGGRQGENFLVVTHKSILRALICTALGLPPERQVVWTFLWLLFWTLFVPRPWSGNFGEICHQDLCIAIWKRLVFSFPVKYYS